MRRPSSSWCRQPAVFLVGWALVGSVSTPFAVAQEPQHDPWQGSFAASADDLWVDAVGATVGRSDAVIVLLEESTRTFAEHGAFDLRHRVIFRVMRREALDDWSTLRWAWSPAFQERPTLRARVVDADGERWLDPNTVDDAPLESGGTRVFSDARVVQAPLPAIDTGDVVEWEVVTPGLAPRFEAGSSQRIPLGPRGAKCLDARVTLDLPATMPFHWEAHGVEATQTTTATDGRVRHLFTFETLPEWSPRTFGRPFDEPPGPLFGYSTAESWAAVATAYARTVDALLAEGAVGPVESLVVEGDARATVDACLQWIREHVRYTGVEFGLQSIVPRATSKTLSEEYGDCKDQSTLLVAMLRHVGIDADVALLRAGLGFDVTPSLPGLGQFDHAIVRVDLEPPLWIDPTATFSDADSLPLPDQGRRALVARDGVAALERTPEASVADNALQTVRTVTLATEGPGHITEENRASGSIEHSLRAAYADLGDGGQQEAFTSRVLAGYGGTRVASFEVTPSSALSEPFVMRMEIEGARRLASDGSTAVVRMRGDEVLGRLPPGLGGGDARASGPMVLPEAHRWEIRHVVVPAPGFDVVELPESYAVDLGPARYEETFARTDEGAVEAVFLFDCGRRHFDAAEADAFRRGWELLQQRDAKHEVVVELAGNAHLDAGRLGEAIAEFRALWREHPQESFYARKLTDALMRCGLQERAAEVMQQACVADAESALAHQALGWVLQHDRFGRLRRGAFDVDGAVAALKRATELAPNDLRVTGDLAILLEHAPNGVRYAEGARLEEAAALYRSLRRDHADNPGLRSNLAVVLDRLGDEEGLLELAREGEGPLISSLAVATVTRNEGVDAGLRMAKRLVADRTERRAILVATAQELVRTRHYTAAQELAEAAAPGSGNAAELYQWAGTLALLQRYDAFALDLAQPKDLLRRWFQAVLLEDADGWLQLLTPWLAERLSEESEAVEGLKASLLAGDADADTVADILFSTMEAAERGNRASGLRVEYTVNGRVSVAYLVEQGESLAIASLQGMRDGLGVEALRRLEAGDLAGARSWIDWAREGASTGTANDPLSVDPLVLLWSPGNEADADTVRLAAAVLAVSGGGGKDHLPLVEEASRATSDLQADVLSLLLAQVDVFDKRWEAVAERTGPLIERHPTSRLAAVMHDMALSGLGRIEESVVRLKACLEAKPDDDTARRLLSDALGRMGLYEESQETARGLVTRGVATPSDYNQLAWTAPFVGTITPQDVEAAQRAVQGLQSREPSSMHTLATLYAEQGRGDAAYQMALQALDALGGSEIPSHYDYILGRIAETYGEAAEAYYRRVEEPAEELDAPLSTWMLAQRRLEALSSSDDAP